MEMQAGRNFSAVGIGFGFLDKYLFVGGKTWILRN